MEPFEILYAFIENVFHHHEQKLRYLGPVSELESLLRYPTHKLSRRWSGINVSKSNGQNKSDGTLDTCSVYWEQRYFDLLCFLTF